MMGDGIYKSTDAGETWTNMGLKDTGRIGTIVVHPTNENIVRLFMTRLPSTGFCTATWRQCGRVCGARNRKLCNNH